MRMTALFSQTLREAPAEAEAMSHQLLLRAGFIRQLAAGIFSLLPLGQRSANKVMNIMREEMNAIGGQEIFMPVVHPAELWQETGRWYQIGTEMGRFKDKADRDMALAMTHEEVVGDLSRKEINSYRQLPVYIYQIQTKWRDDPRPRAGLIRAREFLMKDGYSLDKDVEGLDAQYRANYQAYFNIFNRYDLPSVAVKSDTGMMGGKMAHEFMYLTDIGEDTLLICEADGYAANRQIAKFHKPAAPQEDPAPLEEVETPNATTIEALAQFLDVPKSRTAKAVFMMATVATDDETVDENKFVLGIVRGDMDLNETKLMNAVGAKEMRPATEEEIAVVGAVPGYGSPIGTKGAMVVIDDAVAKSPNLVAGANKVGYHYKNVNHERDFTADIVTDIAAAKEGDASPISGEPMKAVRGVEIGNIFKLGTRYSEALGATFLDANGEQQPIIMGSYGIGVGRALACIAEEHHDDNGLIWPVTVAPYEVQLVVLTGKGGNESMEIADQLYDDLRTAGIEVLYDDRDERPGVKFNDADLLGLPLRITVSSRSLENGGTEFKMRREADKTIVPVEEAVSRAGAILADLHAEIQAKVVEVPFTD